MTTARPSLLEVVYFRLNTSVFLRQYLLLPLLLLRSLPCFLRTSRHSLSLVLQRPRSSIMWSTPLRPPALQFSLVLEDSLLRGLRLLVLSLSTCLNSVSSVLPIPHGPLLFI